MIDCPKKILQSMSDRAKRLLKECGFLFKITQLVLVCVCMNILSECEELTIPKWLWILYSINTTTYAIILLVLSLAHIFERKKNVMEFTYFLLGIILYLIAGISGIIRYHVIVPVNNEGRCDEKTVGIILIICSFLMTFDVCVKVQLAKEPPVLLMIPFRPREEESPDQN